jgi:DNA-binding XRE family transcriptional regulator
MLPVPGVYAIKNTRTGMCYVGSSRDVAARWDAHRNALLANRHSNKSLQAAWRMSDAKFFECVLLELVMPNGARLVSAERRWVDWLRNAGVDLYSDILPAREDQTRPFDPMLPGLLRRRMRAALTQEQLAKQAGVERLTVSRIERGKSASMTTVRKLANALQCEPAELMELDK